MNVGDRLWDALNHREGLFVNLSLEYPDHDQYVTHTGLSFSRPEEGGMEHPHIWWVVPVGCLWVSEEEKLS